MRSELEYALTEWRNAGAPASSVIIMLEGFIENVVEQRLSALTLLAGTDQSLPRITVTFEDHTKAVQMFLAELGPYLGLDDGVARPKDFIAAAARIREGYAELQDKAAKWESWCRPILENMAKEETGWVRFFRRWPISHEPLRSDARNALTALETR